ncbi:MAG: hypothetical protein ACO31I_06235 [Prochlorotrichaceae cyanobacterium]|jgi:hypothetical protein
MREQAAFILRGRNPDVLTWDRIWTDERLYEKYGITDDEIAFINSLIRPMDHPLITDRNSRVEVILLIPELLE